MAWIDPALNWLLLPAMACVALIFGLAERRVFGTWVTPVTTLAWPFIGVAFAAAFASRLGFLPLNPALVLVWLLGVTTFALTGMALYLPFRNAQLRTRLVGSPNLLESERRSSKPVIIGAALITAILGVATARVLASAGIATLGSEEGMDSLAMGIFGHLAVLRMALTIFLIGTAPRLFSTKGLLALLIVLLALVTTAKSWALVPLLAGMFYRVITGRTRLRPSLLIALALASVVIFFGAYMVRWAAINPALITSRASWEFLVGHYANYLFAGVLAGSDAMRQGQDAINSGGLAVVATPLVNLFAAAARLAGTPIPFVSNISTHWFTVSEEMRLSSNVLTLYGSLWLNIGWVGAMLYSGALAVVVYGIALWAHRAANSWLVLMFAFLLALLFLSWFETYFWHLNVLEVPAFCLLFFLLTSMRMREWVRTAPPARTDATAETGAVTPEGASG